MTLDALQDTPPAPRALEGLLATLSDAWVAGDVGPRFTCDEVDSLIAFLRSQDEYPAALAWLTGHAEGDNDPEDRHVLGPHTRDGGFPRLAYPR